MAKKINLLFTIPNFNTAGSQFVLLAIVSRLDVHLFNIYIGVENQPECIPDVFPKGKQLLLPEQNKDYVFNLRKLLKLHAIDVLHSWDYKSNYLEPLACRLAGVKYLYTKKNNAWSKRWQLKSVLSHAIAYDNPNMQSRFFKDWYLKNKTTLVTHGVDTSVFNPQKKTAHENFNICCVGNVVANKNQLFVLEALLKLPETVHLHIYGKEDVRYKALLDTFVSENHLSDRVHFKGYISNYSLPEVFSRHDVFVLASKQEGLPVSLLEALACGLPAMSSNSGGGSRFILEHTLRDLLFELEDIAYFVTVILKLKDDKSYYEKLSEIGISTVKERFLIQKEVELYQQLYKTILF